MNPAVLIIGGLLLVAAVFFAYCKRSMEGLNATIIVVDRRTMKLAIKRIAAAAEKGDYSRAHVGATSLVAWLNDQVNVGPRWRRTEYTRLLKRARDVQAASRAVIATTALTDAI